MSNVATLLNFKIPSTFTGHTGQISAFIAENIEKIYSHLRELNSFDLNSKGAFQQLEEVFAECSFAGWDGENARPISEEVQRRAIEFLKSLPLGIEAPEVGAEPDGDITLEWYRSPQWILSISMSVRRELNYAALFGASKHYGSIPFYGKTPNIILTFINQITAESRGWEKSLDPCTKSGNNAMNLEEKESIYIANPKNPTS